MKTCTKCASLQSDTVPESHPALRRQGVRQRFLDVSETYACMDCGTNWERIALADDKDPIRYRWKSTVGPIRPTSLMIPADCAELDHALASWIRPTFEDQVYA
jgi:hypothetical protein